jgi:flagellar basal body-associated protein FliL
LNEEENAVSIAAIAVLIWILLAITLGIVLVTYAVTYPWVGAKPFDRMGAGDWKFNESWASTLTASGGIIGAILAAQVLPTDTDAEKLTKATFVAFHLLFAFVVIIGAALYNTFRWEVEIDKGGEKAKQYQGFVVCFLLASALVLGAVLGQLATVWYLLGAIPFFPAPIYAILKVFLVVAAALALVYGAISVPWTLRNQKYRREASPEEGRREQLEEARKAPTASKPVRPTFLWP